MSSAEAPLGQQGLLALLRARIRREGPLRLDTYMKMCLADPDHGYWSKAHVIGAEGDFITAPEISQVFGEIIGVWAAMTWQRMGEPAALRLIELGPGRGTLMADALRAAAVLSSFLAAVRVHLIEISPTLRRTQQHMLAAAGLAVSWHARLGEVPPGPAIVIGNEFLDALPVRQLVFGERGWRERTVQLDGEGALQFGLGEVVAFQGHAPPRPGDVAELRSGEDAVLGDLAKRADAVVAAFIDYGPERAGYGDTLQAVQRHAYVDPLGEPGGSDITAHVQFTAFADKARAFGLAVDGPMTQAEFFGRLGMVERAARLMAANPATAGQIEGAVQRLLAPAGMGSQFKVVIVRSPSLPSPAPFA